MNGFLYFLPGVQSNKSVEVKAIMEERGLGYAFDDSVVYRDVCNGPSGHQGLVVGDGSIQPADVKIRHEWEWREMKWAGGAYLGYDKQTLPTIESLARKKQLTGYPVKLANGQECIAPIVLSPKYVSGYGVKQFPSLPAPREIDDEGNWCDGEPSPEYRHLLKPAEDFYKVFADALIAAKADNESLSMVQFHYANRIDAALMMLQANYRIEKLETSILRILSDKVEDAIMAAAIDFSSILALFDLHGVHIEGVIPSKQNKQDAEGEQAEQPEESAESEAA